MPDFFPKIFGPHENEPLDFEAARNGFQRLKEKMLLSTDSEEGRSKIEALSLEEIAYGFIQVGNESMCRPIRALTQSKGLDVSQHVLACFGGAVSLYFYYCILSPGCPLLVNGMVDKVARGLKFPRD